MSGQLKEIDVTGEVLEADLRQGLFQLWVDEKIGLSVKFTPDQEDEVTSALKEHRTRKLHLKGKGEFSSEGKLLRVTEVENWELHPAGEVPFDASARPIEDILAEIASEIPEEEWNKLPSDLSDNLDHYVYGIPKR